MRSVKYLSNYILVVVGLVLSLGSGQSCWADVGGEAPKKPRVKVRKYTEESEPYSRTGSVRDKLAFERKQKVVEVLFKEAGVDFPPAKMLLRGFKKELELEVWAASKRSDELVHVTTYQIRSGSGDLGPKRYEGDGQVPEGFYILDYYNRRSQFYLSMRISYPNKSDRILKKRRRAGSAIMIHGNCVSIGCLAMSDERIQELWVMTRTLNRLKRTVHVHMFPTRDMSGLLKDNSDHEYLSFWKNIKEGFDYFNQHHRLPKVRINKKGHYIFK